jgi:septum formation protein
MTVPPIILASGSPRRRDLLASLGLDFAVVAPDIDETERAEEAPGAYVERLARAKAAAVTPGDALVIAADTTVALDGRIIGKPGNRDDAARMLRELSGRTHTVHTAVACAWRDGVVANVVETEVTFVAMTDADILWYVATGEPDDKAGGYGMQGTGNVFVEHIDGSPSNVVGLPLPTVVRLARSLGVDLLD